MPSFSSPREKRLWLWAAAVVVAIYATLGVARTLADELRRRDLFDSAFALGFLLIIAAIVALGLRLRPGGVEIGVLLGVIAVYGLVFVRMAIPEERTHVVEYGVVAILVSEALVERRAAGRRVPNPFLAAFAITVAVGTVDELLQLAIPSRVFDVEDIVTNAISALMALVAKSALTWARNRSRFAAS